MAPQERTTDEVASFLGDYFIGVSQVEPIVGGEWSRAFSFAANGEEFVVRFGEYGGDYRKDQIAERFASPRLPVPQVVRIGSTNDEAFAISRRIFGEPLDRLEGESFRAVLPSLLSALDELRFVETSASSGFGVWNESEDAPYSTWREALTSVVDNEHGGRVGGWPALLASRPGARAAFDRAARALDSLASNAPEERHVIHADMLGDNVRVSGDQVAGVVDWGASMYGDFLYDTARIHFFQPWYPDFRDVDVLGEARRFFTRDGRTLHDFDERIRTCALHVGLDAQAYDAWTQRWQELERSSARTLEFVR